MRQAYIGVKNYFRKLNRRCVEGFVDLRIIMIRGSDGSGDGLGDFVLWETGPDGMRFNTWDPIYGVGVSCVVGRWNVEMGTSVVIG